MDISQVVAIGIIGCVMSLTVRKMNAEIALFIGIATGILIFFSILGWLNAVLEVLNNLVKSVSISQSYISIIMKVIGIAYIAEFGMDLCKDAGESVISSKIELAGKVIIMAVSAPVVLGVLEMISTILP